MTRWLKNLTRQELKQGKVLVHVELRAEIQSVFAVLEDAFVVGWDEGLFTCVGIGRRGG